MAGVREAGLGGNQTLAPTAVPCANGGRMNIHAGNIGLERPSARHRASYLEARREGYVDTSAPSIGPAKLVTEETVEEHVASLNSPPSGVTQPVPFAHLWLTAGEEFIGPVSIRYELNERLLRSGGHVGYEIRPCYRGRGFGHRALALAMAHLQARGLTSILLTCNDGNVGSARIIEKAGGRHENTISHPDLPGLMLRRYWIELRGPDAGGA